MAISQQLRPLLAQLRHAGGSGEWQTVDGNWQLTLQLPESGGVAERVVTALMHRSHLKPLRFASYCNNYLNI